MYAVSDGFRRAVTAAARRYDWTGTITTTAGQVHAFSREDIVAGSGVVTSRCCGSTEIELGTVYAAELAISLYSVISRYTLMNARVELFYHLYLEDGRRETVPMGIFEVAEANRRARCVELRAYDYMARFEKALGSVPTDGNACDFILFCCEACGVSPAQSRAQLEDLPNGRQVLGVYAEHDMETYRDVLHYIGQVLGGFFRIDREGLLAFCRYGRESVMTIGSEQRFSSSFSDFVTRYTAVSSTNLRTQTAEYYARETDDALTMNLGVNPFLQFGLAQTRREICENILEALQAVRYVPFAADTIGNPALDVGDVVRFSGGQAQADTLACVTASTVRVGGRQTIRCVGKNPMLARAKSRNDKNISGLLSQIEAGKIGMQVFSNAGPLEVGDVLTEILSLEFATLQADHAQFVAQIVLRAEALPVACSSRAEGEIAFLLPAADGEGEALVTAQASLPVSWQADGRVEAEFSFFLNHEEITAHRPAESFSSGMHTMQLYYPLRPVLPNRTNVFRVAARARGGRFFVEAGQCVASVTGQSMAAAASWDGRVELSERVARFGFGRGLSARGFEDRESHVMKGQMEHHFEDHLGRRALRSFGQVFVSP